MTRLKVVFNRVSIYDPLICLDLNNSNLLLDTNIQDLDAAGLSSASVIRMKLFTLDDRLIIRRAGQLSGEDKKAAGKVLRQLFDIENQAG